MAGQTLPMPKLTYATYKVETSARPPNVERVFHEDNSLTVNTDKSLLSFGLSLISWTHLEPNCLD